ncbi:MAG: hypothetical protein KY453_05950, partial [Gemmatimonadetes bacterium]|nr:hypothetical protein [Gemmatimonadota bacterium]
LLLGSCLPEEDEQWAWLEAVLDVGTPIAVFLHKPLMPPPGIGERGGWRYVLEDESRRLAALLARHRERLPFRDVIGGRYGLEDAGRALEDVAEMRVTKAVIAPNG